MRRSSAERNDRLMHADESRGGLSALSREIVRAAAVDAVSKALSGAAVAILCLVGLLVWQGGTVPAWLAALLVLVALGVALRARWQLRQLRRVLAGHEADIGELSEQTDRVDELEDYV